MTQNKPEPLNIAVGFCSKCGIIREDVNGIPITDCTCTALINHTENCFYTKLVSCPIDLKVFCKKHNKKFVKNVIVIAKNRLTLDIHYARLLT